MSDTDRFHEIGREALAASTITDGQAPAPVVEAYEDAATSVSSLLVIAEGVEQKLTEHNEQRDLLPKSGWTRRRQELRDQAKSLAHTAERQFRQAAEKAEDALLASALPALSSDSREALARQELEVALGGVQGPEANARILGIAKSGSPEVQAVLATPYARTALISRNVPDVDRILRDARKTVAQSGSTPEAVKAAEGLEKLKALGAAATAAQRAFAHGMEV